MFDPIMLVLQCLTFIFSMHSSTTQAATDVISTQLILPTIMTNISQIMNNTAEFRFTTKKVYRIMMSIHE